MVVLVYAVEGEQRAELRACLEKAGHTVHFVPEQVNAVALAQEARDGRAAALRGAPALGSLSPREWRVLELMLEHKRTRAIAQELVISPNTVRNHLKKVFAKLGVRSQQEVLDILTANATRS